MERRSGTRHPPPAIQSYVNDSSDSYLPRFLATQSTIPPHHASQVNDSRAPQAMSQTTSMLMSPSDGTRHGSLPALTIATSRATSSVASSIGVRAQEDQQRILEQADGGVLVVPPLREQRILECPFNLPFFCLLTFSNEKDWIDHSLTHFSTREMVVKPPTFNQCCFCEKEFDSPRPYQSWAERMRHICLHHCLGHRLAHARPDFALFKYLFNHHLISDGDYRDLMSNSRGRQQRAVPYPTPPTSPDSPVVANANASIPVFAETYRGRRGDRRP